MKGSAPSTRPRGGWASVRGANSEPSIVEPGRRRQIRVFGQLDEAQAAEAFGALPRQVAVAEVGRGESAGTAEISDIHTSSVNYGDLTAGTTKDYV